MMTIRTSSWSWGGIIVFVAIFLAHLPHPGKAQNHRYWANNFNEEAFLLSGAVVAGNTGTGAIYYNPAAISNIQTSRLSLNSNIISFENMRLINALGENLDIKFNTVKVQPSFISLLLKSQKTPDLTFEFGILNRERTRVEVNDGFMRQSSIYPGLSGEENVDIRIEYLTDYDETWGGFGAGYQINERLSVGASMFVLLKGLSYKYLFDANAFPAKDSIFYENEPVQYFVSNATLRETLKFFQIRFLWKLGLLYATDRWSVGFNLSTPSVPIKFLSSSNASKKFALSNFWLEGGGFAPDLILVDQQKKRPINFKDPLAISVGLRYNTEDRRQTFYTTFEYFSSLDTYKMFDAEFNPNITSEEIFEQLPNQDFLSFYSAARAVFNVAIGYRHRLNERTSILTGFRTDFNYLNGLDLPEQLIRPKDINLNIYHFTGGSMFHIRSSAFILGTQLSYGRQKDIPQFGIIPDDPDAGLPPNPGIGENTMNARVTTISVFVGFNISLGKQKEE